MNNTKRKMCTGVIAAVVCFAMILTSFGALISAAFGILSNEDLINAINNGSLSLGDGVNLSNITLNGGTITDVAKDGYNAVSSNEVAEKKADYIKYNLPYYNNATITALSNAFTNYGEENTNYTVNQTANNLTLNDIAFTDVRYGAQSGAVSIGTNGSISDNTLLYFANSTRVKAAEGADDFYKTTVVSGKHLVIAMATAEQIYKADITNSNDFNLNGEVYGSHFSADGIFNTGIVIIGKDANGDPIYEYRAINGADVYGVCIKKTNFVISNGASLTIVGRDLNGNDYIDDMPVGVDVTGDGNPEWFYEKIVISGSSAFQAFDSLQRESKINLKDGNGNNAPQQYINAIPGQANPLISVVGEYNATDANLSCQLIISGADLRNNFNNKRPTAHSGGSNGDGSRRSNWDDVTCGGGAIHLASASAHDKDRAADTYGMFKNVVITNTRFSYCGSIRGGAVMVGKNFYCPQGVLDFSYSDFAYCYTAYYSYGYTDYSRHVTLSGDGGAVCFFQDDTEADGNWNHNNPSLIYARKVDFTGATFTYCYAMRAGGAIHLGGYYYNKANDPLGCFRNGWANQWNIGSPSSDYKQYAGKEITLGTRIDELVIDHCSFYGCGAGWQIANAPIEGTNVLSDSDFIFTNAVKPVDIDGTSIFKDLKDPLGISDVATGATNASASKLYTLTPYANTSITSYNSSLSTGDPIDIRWMQTYDGNSSNDSNSIWKRYDSSNTTYNTNKARRSWNGWLNLLDTRIYGGAMNGGAINANCRIAEMTISNSTFVYCAADNNGSAIYMSDLFACPKMVFDNCLFKNNLCTVSNREDGSVGADTGTVRATGIAAANIKMNDCSFLYNCNMGEGALYLNINNTYNYDEDNGTTNEAYKKYYVTDPGTEVNDCLFFGNFAMERGAAIYCSGIMDINSSTFAHNLTNAGSGGAITFQTYNRDGIVVSATEAQMQLDPNVGEGEDKTYKGNTIICNNMVGFADGNSGGGGIAVVVAHSGSVGNRKPEATKITVGSITSCQYSFDFKLGGVLVFNNHSNYAGGGILYRVDDDPSTAAVNAWLYNKSIELDNGYIFDNKALQYGGGVSVWDTKSLIKDASTDAVSKAIISGAHIYANEATTEGGGLYLCVKNGDINITGGSVLANVANGAGGGGLMIKDTTNIHILQGKTEDGEHTIPQIGATEYARPVLKLASTGTTFTKGTAMIPGGNKAARVAATNVAAGDGGGIYVLNQIETSDTSFIDKNITLTMTGGLVEGNVAVGDGGGLYMNRPNGNTTYGNITFVMVAPEANTAEGDGASAFGIVGNTAVQGGGIYISSGGAKNEALRYTASISGGAISQNEATKTTDGYGYGGGMFITGKALVTLTGGSVNKNEAGNNGGGVYINNKESEFNMTGGQLSENKTTAMGGGLYAFESTVDINGGTIASNTAVGSGGGACVRAGATLTMSNGSIAGNTTTSGNGGGIFVTPSDGTVQIVPQDGITTLNVGLVYSASSSWMSKNDMGNLKTDFEKYLKDVGYDLSVLKINYKELDYDSYTSSSPITEAVNDFLEYFEGQGLTPHAIIGGGSNIFEKLSAHGYDKWDASVDSDAHYIIKSVYQGNSNSGTRNMAMLTKTKKTGWLLNDSNPTNDPITDLTELLYRCVVKSSTYSCAAADIKTKYSHLAPTTVSTIIGGSSATISGGNVSNNSANVNGGGICVTGDSTFVMNGGNVTANTAKTGNGGGVYTDAVVSKYKVPSDGVTTLKVIAFTNQQGNSGEKLDINKLNQAIADFKTYLVASKYSIGTGVGQVNIELVTITESAQVKDVADAMTGDYSDFHIVMGVGKLAVNGDKGYTCPEYKLIAKAYDSTISRYIGKNKSSVLSDAFYTMVTTGSIATDTTPAPAGGNAVTLTAGNIAGNSALSGNGGGVCCDNGSAVKLNASADNKSYPVIDGNNAKNGGGIAVINGGDVTMQGGYVTNNKAIGTSSFTSKTTYMQSTHNGGVGGGIYVANPYGNTKDEAKFTIENYKDIHSGIYHNNAEFAADDLYANAVNTLISVPAFGDMKIKDDAGNVTGWYEDYATGEANYTVGLNGNKKNSSDYPIERYDRSESNKVFKAWVSKADKDADQEETISSPDRYINGSNFVCVTLGAYVVYDGNMTIIKDIDGAVDPEQVFIFHVQRTHDQYENPTADGDVNLFVTINGEGSVTIHSLPLGIYEVTELTDWSWRYNVQSTSVRVANESGNYVAGADKNDAADIVQVKLEPADDKGACNNPELTFVNVIPSNTPWLDGNSPKFVNTAGATTATSTTVGGQNTGKNVAKTVVYANFKREETLI